MDRRLPFHLQLRNERERRGWTQAELAKKVDTDFKTVYRWESGKSIPRPYYRQKFVELFGKSLSELGLLDHADEESSIKQREMHEDWGEAPLGGNFYGRQEELTEVARWLAEDRCRLVALFGIGGIGKTALAAHVVVSVKDQFQRVFWRSLQNMPPVHQIVKASIECFFGEDGLLLPESLDEQCLLLLKYMREKRCLMVLDNVESVMLEGQHAGFFQQEYLGYERLLRLIGEANHQSCLIITSREKPKEFALFEGEASFARSLLLRGIDSATGRALLQEKALVGSDTQWATLVDVYSGNPLALKLISETVREVFAGDLGSFLQEGEIVFGDVGVLIGQQLQRLSAREKEMLYWLAIEREPTTLEQICDALVRMFSRGEVFATLESLKRRSLLELRGTTHITLQPAIMECMTQDLVKRACEEFGSAESVIWTHYALMKAQSKDYIREIQQRIILAPVMEHLCNARGKRYVVHALHTMLSTYRTNYAQRRSYFAANILHALIYLQSELRGLDFSHLEIRQAYLQFASLQNVNFTGAYFIKTAFKNTFGNVLSVAFHPSDDTLAAGTASGDIWVYQIRSATPLLICHGHTDATWSVAFHPNGNLLASCSDDSTIRLWSLDTGICLRVLKGHENRVRSVAFSPDGLMLVSGGEDHMLRIWQVETGACLLTLAGHTDRIWSVAFHPEGNLVASGSTDQTIRLWDIHQQRCVALLKGHTNWVRTVAFSPDGRSLASGSDDMSIRLWKHDTGECLRRIEGHAKRIWFLAYSPDGGLLASGGEDGTIRVWHANTGAFLRGLHAHVQGIRALSFNASSSLLVSGGEDQTLRLWDSKTGDCLKTIQGYTNRIWSISCSPDGRMVASSGEDKHIRLWNVETQECTEAIPEYLHGARDVVWSPDQELFASCGEDQTVRIWNARIGRCQQILHGHTTWIRTLAWSPDGNTVASGGEDKTVRLWSNIGKSGEIVRQTILYGHTSWVRSVCFNVEGTLLASGGDDYTVRIWRVETGQCEALFQGHSGRVRSVAFNADGNLVASGSEDGTVRVWVIRTMQCRNTLYGHAHWVHAVAFSVQEDLLASSGDDLTIRLWNVQTGQCLWIGRGHSARIRSLCFHPSGTMLISGSDDGTIKFWQSSDGQCLATLSSERPYERMNIGQATGLTNAQRITLLALGVSENE